MTLALNSYQTMAVGIFLYYLGKYLKARIKPFRTYCIPNPVIGGLIFALLNLALHQSGIGVVKLDTAQQSFFMNMFFTSIGFTASIALLKKGGRDVLILTIICAILIICQDIIGTSLAKVFGLHPLLGLCAGSIPLVGGHGTSGAFGPLFESMGVARANTVAIAMATFGLIAGSLMGGPIATKLIRKYNLKSHEEEVVEVQEQASSMEEKAVIPMVPEKFMAATGEILLAMGVGTILANFFKSVGLVFPGYISSMIIAAIIRNLSDINKNIEVPLPEIQTVGDVGLNIFLSMALMSMRIWELFDIAGALSMIAVAQIVLMALFTYYVVFNAMGRNYDAAVEVSAVCGFGMGATPNAMANMSAVTSVFGPSTRAFFCVPLVGAMFIDFVNSSIIMVFVNIFK
ncbi:MAG: sodium/glutamate symporter [Acidaminococcus sp.]|nr:sodium/glutamate symporter [Acidaminococcus sp.]MCI2099540.1 sodium/glutamate symporter [Acidaminococcus sp.]MCI2113625.1 sodium/glutamate symporter [Acidaminococcus sp.]MCI2115708.1 sodium/glutamate symporter [Acidaminococcus sp.]